MSKAQSRELDQRAKSMGRPNERLMETAGKKSAGWLLKKFPAPRAFSVLCGPGHNGGDGWATAFYLKKAGRDIEAFACASSKPLLNLKKKKAQSLKVPIKKLSEWRPAKGAVVIDALFGAGLDRPLKGEFKALALKINKSQNIVTALDIPSGLCADTGRVLGSAVKAHHTLTFALAKPGFYLNEGPSYRGELFVFPIGFPNKLLNQVCQTFALVEKKDGQGFLPSYKDTANKSHRGWALIAAGREGLWGCGLLACRAAGIAGSGYVTWAGKNYPYEKSLKIPEALLARLSDKKLFEKKTALGAGPGLGFSKEARRFILTLKNRRLPAVLDADALTLIAKEKSLKLNKSFLLSPHAGELSRMINVPAKRIEEDRARFAKQGAKKSGGWLLLKGFYPVLSEGEKCWIIPFGNSALGKAGTGDVLTGIITGLMAQGLSPFKAGVLGVILQGESARLWLKDKDINSFSASALIETLPRAMKALRAVQPF